MEKDHAAEFIDVVPMGRALRRWAEAADLLAGGALPESDRTIVAGGKKVFAVGRVGHEEDRVSMAPAEGAKAGPDAGRQWIAMYVDLEGDDLLWLGVS